MYNYEDYLFVPRVTIDSVSKTIDVPYASFQDAFDALVNIIDSESHDGNYVSATIVLMGVYYKGDDTISSMTELETLLSKQYTYYDHYGF